LTPDQRVALTLELDRLRRLQLELDEQQLELDEQQLELEEHEQLDELDLHLERLII
jgi:hypothetical protein